MFIRSRDGDYLGEIKHLSITTTNGMYAITNQISDFCYTLGKYDTFKRCIEILNNINEYMFDNCNVYSMPEE